MGEYRYGLVFLTTLALCTVVLVLPGADWALALTLGLAGGNLLIIVATSRAARLRRRAAEVALVAPVAFGALVVAGGTLERSVALAATGALSVAAIPTTASGLLRLIRARGDRAGGPRRVGIYLLTGLAFAFAFSVLATAGDGAFFAHGVDGTTPDNAYFTFTALTTTGFGDLTVATRVGRALAVLEMLIGQLYLVTVIAVLVANVRPMRSR